jgi:hypothetical protein
VTTTTGDGVLALFHLDPAAIRCPYPLQAGQPGLYTPEIGGVPIPAGSHRMVVYASANRDERRFEGAETIDPVAATP